MGARRSGGRGSVRVGKDKGVAVLFTDSSIATGCRSVARATLLATASFVVFVSCAAPDQALAACPGANGATWSSILGPVLRAARSLTIASDEAAAGAPDAGAVLTGACPATTATIDTVGDNSSDIGGGSGAAAGNTPALSDRARFVFAGTTGTLTTNSEGDVSGDNAIASKVAPDPGTNRFVYAGTIGTLTSNGNGNVARDSAGASSAGLADGGDGVGNRARFVYAGNTGTLTNNSGVEITDDNAVGGDSNRPRFVFADTNASPTEKSGEAIRNRAGQLGPGPPAARDHERATNSGATRTATNGVPMAGSGRSGDNDVSNRGGTTTIINGSAISDDGVSLSGSDAAAGGAATSESGTITTSTSSGAGLPGSGNAADAEGVSGSSTTADGGSIAGGGDANSVASDKPAGGDSDTTAADDGATGGGDASSSGSENEAGSAGAPDSGTTTTLTDGVGIFGNGARFFGFYNAAAGTGTGAANFGTINALIDSGAISGGAGPDGIGSADGGVGSPTSSNAGGGAGAPNSLEITENYNVDPDNSGPGATDPNNVPGGYGWSNPPAFTVLGDSAGRGFSNPGYEVSGAGAPIIMAFNNPNGGNIGPVLRAITVVLIGSIAESQPVVGGSPGGGDPSPGGGPEILPDAIYAPLESASPAPDTLSVTPGTSVPEPATWALLAVGFLALAGLRLRRRRSAA